MMISNCAMYCVKSFNIEMLFLTVILLACWHKWRFETDLEDIETKFDISTNWSTLTLQTIAITFKRLLCQNDKTHWNSHRKMTQIVDFFKAYEFFPRTMIPSHETAAIITFNDSEASTSASLVLIMCILWKHENQICKKWCRKNKEVVEDALQERSRLFPSGKHS